MDINAIKIPPSSLQNTDLLEYLLVAHPDKPVGAKITLEKEYFSGKYETAIAAKTAAHGTIANFMALEAMESTFGKWMQHVIGSLQSFPVTLNNYSGFPPHTIYLRVQNPVPFQQLAQQLKPVNDYVNASVHLPVKFVTRPHFTIARRLKEDVYNRAMAEYAHKNFHETFMVDELVLLRRQHQFDKCKIIQVFKLRPADNDLFSDVA